MAAPDTNICLKHCCCIPASISYHGLDPVNNKTFHTLGLLAFYHLANNMETMMRASRR